MTIAASDSFQKYVWFSVQVDQYYAAVRIFARHYRALKNAHSNIPAREDWPKDFSSLSDSATKFMVMVAGSLNYMGTTGIFEEAPYPEFADLSQDIVNFGFYTCFCFQWTLFENFTNQSLMELVSKDFLPSQVASDLQSKKRKTREFLKYIDQGHVFGHTPFTCLLTIADWIPRTENCDFQDLDTIRDLRNKFIHGVENPSILPKTEMEKERIYERSMKILRQFARNIDNDVEKIRRSFDRVASGRDE
jgi:hypothetical protein